MHIRRFHLVGDDLDRVKGSPDTVIGGIAWILWVRQNEYGVSRHIREMEVVAPIAILFILGISCRRVKRNEVGALFGHEAKAAAYAIEPVPAGVRVTADVKIHIV